MFNTSSTACFIALSQNSGISKQRLLLRTRLDGRAVDREPEALSLFPGKDQTNQPGSLATHSVTNLLLDLAPSQQG